MTATMNRAQRALITRIRGVLTDDLLKPEWRNRPGRRLTSGHCYAASEALYHLLGGRDAGYTPWTIRHDGGPHWWLHGPRGEWLDPTGDQFDTPVPYEQGRGCGFLTRQPSKRAGIIIARVTSATPLSRLDGSRSATPTAAPAAEDQPLGAALAASRGA